MASVRNIPKRSEQDAAFCWNTADLYENDAAWAAEFDACQQLPAQVAAFQGRLGESARTLLDYAFANYTLYTPVPGEELPTIPVKLGQQSAVQPVCLRAQSVLLEKAARNRLSTTPELPERVEAPVTEGQELGQLVLMDGEKEVARIPLVAQCAVDKLSYLQIWLYMVRQMLGQSVP